MPFTETQIIIQLKRRSWLKKKKRYPQVWEQQDELNLIIHKIWGGPVMPLWVSLSGWSRPLPNLEPLDEVAGWERGRARTGAHPLVENSSARWRNSSVLLCSFLRALIYEGVTECTMSFGYLLTLWRHALVYFNLKRHQDYNI